ncbi:MAG TPA: phosphatase PAP2 family protein [Gaiellaceae bacterium]
MLLASIDDRIAVWMATHRVEVLNDPTVWIGTIDRLGAVWIVLAVVVGVARRCGAARIVLLAGFTALTTLAADSASFAVKDLVDRTRPFVGHPEIHPLYAVHSSSFPAGHAATSFAGATLLSYVAPRAAPLFVALAAAIGVSRVYDGVHYPTDVLGGAAIGIAVGAGAAGLLALARRRRSA